MAKHTTSLMKQNQQRGTMRIVGIPAPFPKPALSWPSRMGSVEQGQLLGLITVKGVLL